MQKETAKTKNPKLENLLYAAPSKLDYALFAVAAFACFFLFNHPDIEETARHAYILIKSTFDGQFLNFFENTFTRVYGYQYTNAAHYNIIMYILYALWELPLYLIEKLAGVAFSDTALALWCKCIGTGFYLGSAVFTGRLAKRLGAEESATKFAPLMFLLNPVSFFTVLVMGQYDSLCVFFMLLALVFYFDENYTAFSLVLGVAMVFKTFPLFLLVPLVLLVEKRPLHIVKYLVLSFWLYIPTTLLFAGRTGDAAFFNSLMAERLFEQTLPMGTGAPSIFGVIMALVCVGAFIYKPRDEKALQKAALYIGLLVFTSLFAFIYWHPQWLILLVPFAVLTTLTSSHKSTYFYLSAVTGIGFFMVMNITFQGNLEGNLLLGGVFAKALAPLWAAGNVRTVSFYYALLPYFLELAPIMFYGGLFAALLFKLPLGAQTLGEKLNGAQPQTGEAPQEKVSYRLAIFGVFAISVIGFWLVPSMFSFLKSIAFI